MAGSVTEFVKRRAVPVDRFEIRLWRRDLHIVLRGDVERAAASDADVDPSGLDQGLDSWLDKAGLWRRASDGNLLRHALALRHVEDGEALQKCHGLGLFVCFHCPILLILWDEAIGVYYGCSVLTPEDIAAKVERLAKGEPALSREATLAHGAPQDQHIDPRIGAPGSRILRQTERRLCCCGGPRLDPWHSAGFELSDDLVGDFIVKSGPVRVGAGMGGVSGHRGPPRRALRASLATSNP